MAGIVLTGSVASEVDGLRRALGAETLGRIAPHITLVPPVNVSESDLPEALDVARRAAASSAPFVVELGPPRTFFPPNPVLYLAVGGDVAAVSRLSGASSTGPLAEPKGRRSRPFVPHVTLDNRMRPPRLEAAMVTLADYRSSVTVERSTLLEYDEDASRWSALASFPLGRPRVVGRGGLEVELSVEMGLDPVASRFVDDEWRQHSIGRHGGAGARYEPAAVVARIGDEIVGVAEGELRGSSYRLARLIVAPQWRSHGAGAQLLKAVEVMAAEHGCARVRLETIAGGEAERFYGRHGYAVVATLPEWRDDADFVLMERSVSVAGGPR